MLLKPSMTFFMKDSAFYYMIGYEYHLTDFANYSNSFYNFIAKFEIKDLK
jgi:hypothetical protein